MGAWWRCKRCGTDRSDLFPRLLDRHPSPADVRQLYACADCLEAFEQVRRTEELSVNIRPRPPFHKWYQERTARTPDQPRDRWCKWHEGYFHSGEYEWVQHQKTCQEQAAIAEAERIVKGVRG